MSTPRPEITEPNSSTSAQFRSLVGRPFGPYRVEAQIARGGQGAVLEAVHRESGRKVALKLLFHRDSHSVRRFCQEARVLQRLSHPGLPDVLDLGEHDGIPYLAMDLIEGESLADRVRRQGVPPIPQVVEVLSSVAETLQYCHQEGIVHRDLKPKNIVLEASSGRPFLVDFGVVQRDPEDFGRLSSDERHSRLSRTGDLLGTPQFMAPEQVDRRFGAIGPWTDVYGLGATLYALLTNSPPFTGQTHVNVCLAVLEQSARDPRGVDPAIPAEVARLCLQCLEKDPGLRPTNATAFADALRRSIPDRPERDLPPWAWIGAAGVVTIALGAVGGLAWRGTPGPPAQAPTPRLAVEEPAARGSPDGAWAVFQQGLAQADRKEYEAAIASFTRALELDPSLPDAWLNRAVARDTLGDWEGAFADLTRALELDPGLARALERRAKLFLDREDYGAALADFSRVLELEPANPAVHSNLGMARGLIGDNAGAIQDFNRGLELEPGNPTLLLNRGKARRDMGDLAGALADYTELLGVAPGDWQARFHRGMLLVSLNDLPGAIEELTRCLELQPNLVDALANRAAALFRLGDRRGAVADYLRVARLQPDYPGVFADLGLTLANLGDYEEAIEHLTRALKIEPDRFDLVRARGMANLTLGLNGEALADLKRAMDLQPDPTLYVLRGRARLNMGDTEQALADFDRALPDLPNDFRVFTGRANALTALGRYREAEADLQRAMEVAPNDKVRDYVRRGLRELEKRRAGR